MMFFSTRLTAVILSCKPEGRNDDTLELFQLTHATTKEVTPKALSESGFSIRSLRLKHVFVGGNDEEDERVTEGRFDVCELLRWRAHIQLQAR